MNKVFLLVPALALTVGLMATGDASADNTPVPQVRQVSPAILKLFATNVHGSVDITAAKKGEYANMTCDKLSISASSVAQTPCNPSGGGFCVPSPKWTHTQAALTASATPGICNYTILVPGGQAFGLSASTQVNLCGGSGLTYVNLKPSPSTGQLTVPAGGSKDADLVVTEFQKACIN